jgi:hypothetical protein
MPKNGTLTVARSGMTPSTKTLFIVMAVLEAAIGLALIAAPSVPIWLLLGTSLDTPTAMMIARLAGVALVSLGAMCWFASRGEKGSMLSGLMAAMLFYNIGAAAILAYAGIGLGLSGPGLWPTLLVHLLLAAVCIASLAR